MSTPCRSRRSRGGSGKTEIAVKMTLSRALEEVRKKLPDLQITANAN